MKVLRTPEDRFAALEEDWPASYAEVSDPDDPPEAALRMAYVDLGPRSVEAPVALLLHGEPTWSFLYRDVVADLVARGVRCVVPDLVGFGRSDKPVRVADHSYARHVEWVRELVVDVLDLHDVVLVGQDWGGLIGLRLVAEHPERFAAVVAANTGLPTGDRDMPEVWWDFRRAVERAEVLDVGRLVASGCARPLRPGAREAYDAPFPDEAFKAGPRAMPLLVPTRPDDPATAANRAAWERLARWERPFLTAFSDLDPITGAMAPVLRRTVPGAAGLEHPVVTGAGHFLQEDDGPALAAAVATVFDL